MGTSLAFSFFNLILSACDMEESYACKEESYDAVANMKQL